MAFVDAFQDGKESNVNYALTNVKLRIVMAMESVSMEFAIVHEVSLENTVKKVLTLFVSAWFF